MNRMGLIYRKEMRMVLRERRVILTTLLLPIVLMPVLMFGPSLLFGNLAQQTAASVQQVGVVNLPPEVMEVLKAARLEPVEVTDPRLEVEQRRLEVAVAYANQQFTVYGRLAGGATQSSLIIPRVQAALQGYREGLVQQQWVERGLDPALLQPFTVVTQDASPPQEAAAGLFGFLIPYFLVIFVMVGGQVVAIDATAGEKEKGTLEALLVTPVPLAQVVLGKALATLTMALAAALASLSGILLGSTVVRNLFTDLLDGLGGALGGGLSLTATGYLSLLLTAVLFALFIVAVMLSLGLYARSFKEAQSYLAPLQLIFILPLLALQFADFLQEQTWFYLLPAFNVMLSLSHLVRGSAELPLLLLTWATTLVYALLALLVAIRQFRREEIVFRN